MTPYLHHVPGQLRLKTLSLKNNEAKAAEIRALFAQLPGIKAVELNLVTGSMLVRYDTVGITAAKILGFLVANSVITSIPEACPRLAPRLLTGSMAERATDNLADVVSRLLADFLIGVLPRAAVALARAAI
jgi:Heavy metal associated domain 2